MSFALDICVPIISAYNLCGISGHATRLKKKKRNALCVRPVGQVLYLAEPKGLIRNPDIYETVGALRHPRHHHWGAVIAPYITRAVLYQSCVARFSEKRSQMNSLPPRTTIIAPRN